MINTDYVGEEKLEIIVEINNATKKYYLGDNEITALEEIFLFIAKGDFISLVGPSGCGKSTLMNVIGGLDSLDEGYVKVEDQDISLFDDETQAIYRRKKIGFVFQTFNLQSRLTALENVELPLLFEKIPHKKRKEMALTALDIVGLTERVKHKPSEMSGGQQQRVAIARSIVNSPQILLADEPTGNLDEESGTSVMKLLSELNSKYGITILMVTHNEEYTQYAQQVLYMKD